MTFSLQDMDQTRGPGACFQCSQLCLQKLMSTRILLGACTGCNMEGTVIIFNHQIFPALAVRSD